MYDSKHSILHYFHLSLSLSLPFSLPLPLLSTVLMIILVYKFKIYITDILKIFIEILLNFSTHIPVAFILHSIFVPSIQNNATLEDINNDMVKKDKKVG